MPDKTSIVHDILKHTAHMQQPDRLAGGSWAAHIPFAFWLVEATRPRLLVELGTFTGTSFCAFCQQVRRLGLDCMCYAVDSWEGDSQATFYDASVYDDLQAYVAEHYSYFAHLIREQFDNALGLFRDGSIDLLHIDGYHSCEAMLHDFETWLPKMSSQGVVLMHDINARIPGYGGVRAWEEISARFPHFTFEHGYGLGVLLTGTDIPQELQYLVQCQGKQPAGEEVRQHFMFLGTWHEAMQRVLLERDDLRRQLAEEQQRHTESREAATRCIQDAQCRMNELTKATEVMLSRYEKSLSWRVTKPLRSIANWVRKLRY